MSLALPLLAGLLLGVSALSLSGWPLVILLAGMLFVGELIHDLRSYREVGE